MTDKDEAKPAPKWGVIEVHPGELTEIMAIPEGTIYRTTHFHEHGTDIPGHTTAIPAAELEALTKMRDQMACDLDEEGS